MAGNLIRNQRPTHTKPAKKTSLLPKTLLNSWLDRLGLEGLSPASQEKLLKNLLEKNRTELTKLWSAYNESRDFRKLEPNARSSQAYFMGFHLNNVQRIYDVFQRAQDRNKTLFEVIKNRQLRLLDLGCGSGAFCEAFLSSANIKPDSTIIEMIDQNKFHLQLASQGIEYLGYSKPRRLHARLSEAQTQHVVEKVLMQLDPTTDFMVLGMSYVFNEILKDVRSLRLIEFVLTEISASPTPALIGFFEPGRESEARAAMAFRHEMIEMGYQVIYPCPSSLACPMGLDQKDWCYSEVNHHQTPQTIAIDGVLKLKRQRLATAAYLFVNAAASTISKETEKIAPKKTEVFVGKPTVSGAEISLYCDGHELKRRSRAETQTLRGTHKS